MSVLIRGMDMPLSGEVIVVFPDGGVELYSRNDVAFIDFPIRHRSATKLPPHGRLIDADAFAAEMRQRQMAAEKWRRDALEANDEEIAVRADAILSFLSEVKLTMDKMPTILEAEGEV